MEQRLNMTDNQFVLSSFSSIDIPPPREKLPIINWLSRNQEVRTFNIKKSN